MSGSQYRAEIDLRDVNESHSLAIAGVPAGSSVLDVGVADGSIASALRRLGCRVWGIEIDPSAAEAAREFCEDVIIGDIESVALPPSFSGSFDVVLLLDVLEHLKDPVATLQKIAGLLAPAGWVVVSLPNVAHGAVRLNLLHGRWSYTPLGLLDDSHLRFFNRSGAESLLQEAGYSVFDRSRVVRRIDGTEIPIDLSEQYPDVLAELASDPDAETYQFLFFAAPQGSRATLDPPFLPVRILQERVRQLEAVEQQPAAHVATAPDSSDWFLQELAALRAQSQQRRAILQDMLNELQQSSQQLSVEIGKFVP